ncbi:hypothetical protein LTR37_002770 [Vermiconidia calcicola]|uniref:Uncharacterized protein n=1 Tax=Vermiconidia calcicola TaxID=1690605 RepID=A0ACC3NUJ3_9PEZI|nr:hypothetical protein LTR37_002770 [Vermiconidia calcicola]
MCLLLEPRCQNHKEWVLWKGRRAQPQIAPRISASDPSASFGYTDLGGNQVRDSRQVKETDELAFRGPFKAPYPSSYNDPCEHCRALDKVVCLATWDPDCKNFDKYRDNPIHPHGRHPPAVPGAAQNDWGIREEFDLVLATVARQPPGWTGGTQAFEQGTQQQTATVPAHGVQVQQIQRPQSRGAQAGPSGSNARPQGQQQSREGGSNRGTIPPKPTGQVTQRQASGDPKGRQGAPRDGKKGQGSGGARPHLR